MMAKFTPKSAIFRALTPDLGGTVRTSPGRIVGKMAELLMNSACQAKDQYGRVGPGYLTGVVRTWRCGPFLPKPSLASNRVPLRESRCRPVSSPKAERMPVRTR